MGVKRIAIVDDNASVRTILSGLASEGGFDVVGIGADGDDAIKICETHAPEVVIMDVSMPAKDGIEAAREINKRCPTPIILLTARSDEGTMQRAIDAGVMGYLVKPVKLEDLRPAIELAASRFRELETLDAEVEDLKTALAERKIVEKAKGLIMEKEGVSEDEAFRRLRKISMDKRKSLAEIADIVISALESDNCPRK
jgi:response regulator NasT